MPIFYVHQKQTYSEERRGGFVWSPQKTMTGQEHVGFSNMTLIHRGDFILHHCKGDILAIGKATSDCYKATKPKSLVGAWDNQGYKVDVAYFDLRPLYVLNYEKQLSKIHNAGKGNAFTYEGRPSQFYMCVLTNEQAFFLLNHILAKQTNETAIAIVNEALAVVREDYEFDDDIESIDEAQSIDAAIESGNLPPSPSRKGLKKQIETIQSSTTNRVVPKRDATVAISALCIADHKCEVNKAHMTFTRKKTAIPYMESHHLIPISRFRDFNYSLDVEENIVSLCPICHRLLHHGRMSDKEPILRSLLLQRIAGLRQCGIGVTLEKLKEYYM